MQTERTLTALLKKMVLLIRNPWINCTMNIAPPLFYAQYTFVTNCRRLGRVQMRTTASKAYVCCIVDKGGAADRHCLPAIYLQRATSSIQVNLHVTLRDINTNSWCALMVAVTFMQHNVTSMQQVNCVVCCMHIAFDMYPLALLHA